MQKKNTTKNARGGRTSSSAKTTRGSATGRRPATGRVNPALTKPVTPDESLAAVVGKAPLPRPQVIKKVWDYIKAEGLQDPKEKRMINADETLRPVFDGKKRVDMFEMTKLVSHHVR